MHRTASLRFLIITGPLSTLVHCLGSFLTAGVRRIVLSSCIILLESLCSRYALFKNSLKASRTTGWEQQLSNKKTCHPYTGRNILPPSLSIYLQLYSPLLGLGLFFSLLILYTISRTPLTRDQPFARSLYLYTGQHKHRINAQRHPCFEWDSNPRSEYLSGRRWFMP
jgi:hypothetical protein